MTEQDRRPAAPARRGRIARLTGRRATEYSPLLEPLMRTVRQRTSHAEQERIVRAFEVAERAHEGQMRRSGDPYITHPVAVATILAELGVTGPTLLAALLHDTVEDTDYSLAQLTADFGSEVALLVDGVTKLDKVTYGAAAQAETVRKMVIAMAQDVNVLLIKLADRLHNARTWRYVSPESSAKKARETLDIYAPLAHRLGMNTVKWELEDLSFAALKPKVYAEIVRLVGERNPEREKHIAALRGAIEEELREHRVRATVTGRPKHYYSIYQKMVTRGKDFDDIHDLTGIRVLVDSVRDCYGVLGVVHARWRPLPGRFKDYIAVPKLNMYRSLHTTVMGPDGKPVEIQIRTWDMHRQAEYGVAAHWRYKAGARGEGTDAPAHGTPGWLRSVMDWQHETSDPDEFLSSLRTQIGADEVYVFTPKGEIRSLPAGSTPVDFAYAIHTDVGHRTVGARVDGRLVPLSTPLNQGETVEVFTSKAEDAGPSRDWLNFVVSPRAKSKIRHHFATRRRDEQIERGREAFTRQLRRAGMSVQKVLGGEDLDVLAGDLGYHDPDGLFAALADGHVSPQAAVERLAALQAPPAAVAEPHRELAVGEVDLEGLVPAQARRAPARATNEAGVLVDGDGGVLAKLARCCNPLPPDEVVGFVTRGSGVSVHRHDCRNLATILENEPERRVAVTWAPSRDAVYTVEIEVQALDRTSLLSDVTRILAENHVNILSASVNTTRDRVAMSRFVFEMGDPLFLEHVVNAVRRIDGVFEVRRI